MKIGIDFVTISRVIKNMKVILTENYMTVQEATRDLSVA